MEQLIEILTQINDLSGGALAILTEAQGAQGGAAPEGGEAPVPPDAAA